MFRWYFAYWLCSFTASCNEYYDPSTSFSLSVVCWFARLSVREPNPGSGCHSVSRPVVVRPCLPSTLLLTAMSSRASMSFCTASSPSMASRRFLSWTLAPPSTVSPQLLTYTRTSHFCLTASKSRRQPDLLARWRRWPQVPRPPTEARACPHYALPPAHDHVATPSHRTLLVRLRAALSQNLRVEQEQWPEWRRRRWRFHDTRDHRIRELRQNVALAFRWKFILSLT